MRMSVSRLAALGAALLAGATLAACSSSGVPFAPTGNNNQITSFPGAPVRFIQGSPNLSLGITLADFCVDGKFVVTLDYAQQTPYIASIPAGTHAVTLYQNTGAGSCTANPPLFTAANVTLAPNTKYSIVAEGSASFGNAKLALFVEPHYNVAATANVQSFFDAAPNATNLNGHIDIWDNTLTPGINPPATNCPGSNCGLNVASFLIAGGVSAAGGPLTGSSKVNVLLSPVLTNKYCEAAYQASMLAIILVSRPAGNTPRSAVCTSTFTMTPGVPQNVYVIDSFTANQVNFVFFNDQNG